ncbi:MAG TPA: zinc ribbon domain-containing protein [Bellilinea sp.]|nr:zinc ribbon domain-containing protein [Bellilinea sp.]
MDIGSLLLVIAVALLTGIFIAYPFLDEMRGNKRLISSPQVSATEHAHSALLAKREQVLAALQELDMDHDLGKIPAEDYPVQREALLQEGVAALKALEEIEKGSGAGSTAAKPIQNGNGRKVAGNGDDSIEQMIAARKRDRSGKSDGFCPKCGAPVLSNDAFCPKCGKPL